MGQGPQNIVTGRIRVFRQSCFPVVSGFLGWRLYSVLGRRTGHEKRSIRSAPGARGAGHRADREGNVRRLPEPARAPERVDRDRRKL